MIHPSLLLEALPFLGAYLVFYALVLRPPRQREAARQAMVASLAPGARVVLTSGFIMTVRAVSRRAIEVETESGIRYLVSDLAIDRLADQAESALFHQADRPAVDAPHALSVAGRAA